MSTTTMQDIANVGMMPVSKADQLDQPLANLKARKTAGVALADMLCTELQQQAGKLKMFVQSLMDLDSDGREAFTGFLSKVLKDRRVLVKENGSTLYKAINASASVRLSEMTTIAKALDKGHTIDLEQSYHTIVGQAREFLRGLGAGDKRGRKATHAVIKAYKSMLKLETINDEDRALLQSIIDYAGTVLEQAGLAVEVEA